MISVVLPALDEIDLLSETVASIGPREDVEVVVADGGSRDGTLELARRLADRVVVAPRSRGVQLSLGAATAHGEILLFLHADTRLGPGALPAVRSAVAEGAEAGAFRLGIDSRRAALRVVEMGVRVRSALFGLPYGDQAIWITRGLFERLGGFRPIPVLEDLDLVLRIRDAGLRMRILDPPVATSARRWERDGVLGTSMRNLIIAGRYIFGDRHEKRVRPVSASGILEEARS